MLFGVLYSRDAQMHYNAVTVQMHHSTDTYVGCCLKQLSTCSARRVRLYFAGMPLQPEACGWL